MRLQDMSDMRRQPLFRQVEPAQVDIMLRGSFLQRFPAHVELLHDGEMADFLHIVIEGRVELYSSYRDRETTLSFAVPGESFVLAAVLMDLPYLQSARGLIASRILMVPADAVREAFASDPNFARTLAEELALSYRGVVKELKNQKLRSGLERLANWLLTRDAECGATGRFDFPFGKKVLASRLGMAPEVLSRTLTALAAYHVVVQGAAVVMNDVDALRKLAHPSSGIDGSAT